MNVPCEGCVLCCRGDAIRLLPEDDISQYEIVPHVHYLDEWMLDHKKNGDCIYLDENGCSIHPRRPLMCREMDCRNLARNITYTNARQFAREKKLPLSVWKRGKELLRKL